MIFHYRQRNIKEYIPELKIKDVNLNRVTDFNFLGIVFDENLNWNVHTQKIANKVSRTVGLLCRLKRTLPQHTLRLIAGPEARPGEARRGQRPASKHKRI